MSEVRDRIANPSINFPESADEAFQALLHSVRRVLFEDNALNKGALDRVFTKDAGLGHTRRQQQADWLNEQQSMLRAQLEDYLDRLDLESRMY
jgi:hypothetical protein